MLSSSPLGIKIKVFDVADTAHYWYLPRMAHCLLCPNPLDASVKPEHVWLASLGGRKTTRRALCSSCNQALGSGPDKALAESVAVIRNLMNFQSNKGDAPPTIKGQAFGKTPVALKPGGVPVLQGGPPFTLIKLADDKYDVQISVTSEEHLQRIIPDLARALKMPEADVRRQLVAGDVRYVTQRIETQHHRLSLGGPEAMRSMLKTCLTLWADQHGSDEFDKPSYADAKCYVRYGGEALARAISKIDPTPLPDDAVLVAQFGKHYNLACVASDESGRVAGYFRLYNIAAWRFTLCPSGGIPSAIVGLVSNPEDPKVWKEIQNEDFVKKSTILSVAQEFDLSGARSSLVSIYESYRKAGSEKEIERICDAAAKRLGLKEGAPMTSQQLDKFIHDVSSRMTSWILGLPHEDTLSADEVSRLVNGEKREP